MAQRKIDITTLPSRKYAAVTAHDSTNLVMPCRGIFVGGAGNIVAVMLDDTTCTFTGVPAGTILPIVAKRINATNTTATNMVALF